ncbi:MAG: DUF2726 domain-containing protein [bacterium]|nr:DUF2726 domain-containing protein [bacterium]
MIEPVYKKQGQLMNYNEQSLYKSLKEAFGQEYLIVPQVHLEKLIKPARWIGKIKYAIGHVSRKSVDFAFFDKETFEPILAIELNGQSHQRTETYLRDIDVRKHLEESNLPIITLENGEIINTETLKRKVYSVLTRGKNMN